MRSRLLASTFVLTILVLTHPALVAATDSFTIEANPTTAMAPQGGLASYTITVGSFSGLPVTFGVTGLPSGAAAAFNPPSCQPPASGTTSSILTVTARVDTPVGIYQLNVTASDSSGTHWVIVTLNVLANTGDFVISVPNSLTANRTETYGVLVEVYGIGSWRWGIALNVTGLPEHVTGMFTPPVVEPPLGGSVISVMMISVGADAISGTYQLTIVATVVNATVTRWVPFTLIILPTIASVAGPNVGLAFAFMGIGVGVAAAGVGVAFALSGQRGSEVIVYGGYYCCRKHRVPLWYMHGRLWCPIEQKHLRV